MPELDTDPAWLKIAYREIGEIEIKGKEHNPQIIEYHSATSLMATEDEVPWCSSFVNWCMQGAGLDGTDSAVARTWLSWGKPILKPYRGCVAVFQRGNSGWQGHVGFYIGEQGGDILLLGGNQSDSVNIMKYSKDKLLGFRTPGTVRPH